MKKYFFASLIVVTILAITGIGLAEKMGKNDKSMMDDTMMDNTKMDSAMMSGAGLWKNISAGKSYTGWKLLPGTEKMQKGGQPHGAFVSIYGNKTALDAFEMKKGTFADGSVIVKENFRPDKTLAAITVMQKSDGFNRDGGDWFWAKYKPDGTIDAEGKVQSCINCHHKAADKGWVFSGKRM